MRGPHGSFPNGVTGGNGLEQGMILLSEGNSGGKRRQNLKIGEVNLDTHQKLFKYFLFV